MCILTIFSCIWIMYNRSCFFYYININLVPLLFYEFFYAYKKKLESVFKIFTIPFRARINRY